MTGRELYEKWVDCGGGEKVAGGYSNDVWERLSFSQARAWDDLAAFLDKNPDEEQA